MDYMSTADCKDKTSLTDEEKQQIVDYFKKHGRELSPDEIIEI